jgi:hypothetical protein
MNFNAPRTSPKGILRKLTVWFPHLAKREKRSFIEHLVGLSGFFNYFSLLNDLKS